MNLKQVIYEVTSPAEDATTYDVINALHDMPCRFNINFVAGIITFYNLDSELLDDIEKIINQFYTILNVDVDNSITEKSDNPMDLAFKNLKKTFDWALSLSKPADRASTAISLQNFLYSTIRDISMNYNRKYDETTCNIGDIVECEFGQNLIGEPERKLRCIVCNISEKGMLYVLPIVKKALTKNCIPYASNENSALSSKEEFKGFVSLDMGRYINSRRLRQVVGIVKKDFFEQVLSQLSTVFDFTGNLDFIKSDSNDSPSKTNSKSTVKDLLMETFSEAFEHIDLKESRLKQTERFMGDIGMLTTFPSNFRIKSAFYVACTTKEKITYESIVTELHDLFPAQSKTEIRKDLKSEFDEWLAKYPDLSAKKKFSLMSVLKAYVEYK